MHQREEFGIGFGGYSLIDAPCDIQPCGAEWLEFVDYRKVYVLL